MTRIATAAAMVLVAGVAVFVWGSGVSAAQNTRLRFAEPQIQLFGGEGSSIGVTARDVTTDDASKAKLDGPRGVFIEDVRDGTPAARAGFRSGDIVLEYDGERVRSVQQFTRLVQESAAGRPVSAVLTRDGGRQTLSVTPERGAALDTQGLIARRADRNVERLRSFPFNFDVDGFPPEIRTLVNPRQLGATLTPLSEQLEAYFGVTNGVLVSSVESDSPASAGGLRAGDVITQVNGRRVDGPDDVGQAVRSTAAGSDVEITVTREKKQVTLKARIPERRSSSGRRGVTL
jgi:serine protease Do